MVQGQLQLQRPQLQRLSLKRILHLQRHVFPLLPGAELEALFLRLSRFTGTRVCTVAKAATKASVTAAAATTNAATVSSSGLFFQFIRVVLPERRRRATTGVGFSQCLRPPWEENVVSCVAENQKGVEGDREMRV